ncbi:MAG: histidinol-phosphate transaminase [Coriobacteriia bacterium]|nr:histidinol-phosphate transaminase [Coriobacteriia bacterium]
MQWDNFLKKNLEPIIPYQPGLREEQVLEIAQSEKIYKLSSNESPFAPFPTALAAMAEAMTGLNEYPDGSSDKLIHALAEHYQVPTEQLILGNGSNELLDLIAQTCLLPGDEVLYCWPSFVVYRSSAQVSGAVYTELPLAADSGFDLSGLLAAVTPQTKIVYICSPNNPTGVAVGARELTGFLAALPKQVLVILDVAYEEFMTDDVSARALDYFDGVSPVVVLKTFSKIYALAGIRVGYGFAPAPLVEAVNKVRAPFNVNSLAQVAAQASLNDQAELKRRCQINQSGRQRLYAGLDALGLDYSPSQANFVWVRVKDAQKAFTGLLKRGVIVRPFASAEAFTSGLRVTIGNDEAIDATIAAFAEVLQAD